MCLFPIEIGRLMGLGSRRIECRKLFYRMPFRVAFLWPSWKCSCWNSRGASFALRLPCHLLLISIPLNHLVVLMGGTGPRLGAYYNGVDLFNFLASVRTKPEIWKYASNAMFHRSVMSVHQSLGQSTLGQTSIVGSFLASCMLPATFNRAVCLNESVWVWLIQSCSCTHVKISYSSEWCVDLKSWQVS